MVMQDVFSKISDAKLAKRAIEINEKSSGAFNPGLCIMRASQDFALDGTRTIGELAKTLRAFGDACKDETLQRCMVAAADGFERAPTK